MNLTYLKTEISPDRLGNLIAYSFFCSELPGCFAEFGVKHGGSLELIAKCHPKKIIYGIDGFEGLPKPSEFDTHKEGEFDLTEKEYFDLVTFFGIHYPHVRIHKGYSPEIFDELEPLFSFVHVDVDLYQSVKDAFDYFYPRLVKGGMMIFDDYGFESCPGAKKAIDEWNQECAFRGALTFANDIFCGQYLIIK